MRQIYFRLKIRTLIFMVALVALLLVGVRVYRDDPKTQLMLLKLKYGNTESRRSAIKEIYTLEYVRMFYTIVDQQISKEQWQLRQRRAELLFPVILHATDDPDAGCRANALEALSVLVFLYGSESRRSLVLHRILAAARDKDESVRTSALCSMVNLATQDIEAVIHAIGSGSNDPSVEIRQTAATELGSLGVSVPTSQPAVYSILVPLLASQDDPHVRIKAAWALSRFGNDLRRHQAGAGPDVIPALVAALRDHEVDVRRTSATILGSSFKTRGRAISLWYQRKEFIIPSLRAAMSDSDKIVRDNSALALFLLGERNGDVISLIEQAAQYSVGTQKSEFVSALNEWLDESKADNSTTSGPGKP